MRLWEFRSPRQVIFPGKRVVCVEAPVAAPPPAWIPPSGEERRYLALDPIRDDWDVTQYYNKTNIKYTRTTVFWEKDDIKKIVYEENRLPVGQTNPSYRAITEHDTIIKTENREKLIPLTPRGKPKPVTASNIMSFTPFGCSFHFQYLADL